MKKISKLTAMALAFVMALALLVPCMTGEAGAAGVTKKYDLTFSDVQPGAWYYECVMEMTEMGLFNGCTAPVNGVGTFAPNAIMTREQFYTVLARALYPDEYNNFDYSTLTSADLAPLGDDYTRSKWGTAAEKIMKARGVGDYSCGEFYVCYATSSSQPIDRNTAAMLMVQSMECMGGDEANFRLSYKTDAGVDTFCRLMEESYQKTFGTSFRSDVTDWDVQTLSMGTSVKGENPFCWSYYAYALGLMGGQGGGWNAKTQTWTPVNLAGTRTLTRAEGAALIYRMLNENARTEHPELQMMGIQVKGRTANTDYARYNPYWDEPHKLLYAVNLVRSFNGQSLMVWDSSLANTSPTKVINCQYGGNVKTAYSMNACSWYSTSIFEEKDGVTRFYCEYNPTGSIYGRGMAQWNFWMK